MIVRTYQLVSWDMTPLEKQVRAQPMRMPDMVYGFGCRYHLRRTAFRPRANAGSPYLLDAVDAFRAHETLEAMVAVVMPNTGPLPARERG